MLLDGNHALTGMGRNRAAANPRENFMATEREISLRSQSETGCNDYPRVELTCLNSVVLLRAGKGEASRAVHSTMWFSQVWIGISDISP